MEFHVFGTKFFELPNVHCHSTNVERAVKNKTEGCRKVKGQVAKKLWLLLCKNQEMNLQIDSEKMKWCQNRNWIILLRNGKLKRKRDSSTEKNEMCFCEFYYKLCLVRLF